MSDYVTLTTTAGSTGTTYDSGTLYTDATDYTFYHPQYYPQDNSATWVGSWPDYGGIEELKEEIRKLKEVKQVKERTLFRVYVVDPRKGGSILMDGNVVVAEDENQALLKSGVSGVVDKAGLELEQVDVYTEKIGTFIRPRKETQRVKITKEEDD